MRRDRSPIPPPREPKRDNMWMRDRERMERGPPPPHRRRSPSPPYKRHRREDEYYERHERYSPRYRGRSPEYGRYDEYEYYGGGPPHQQQPPPPPRREERRGAAGGGGPDHAAGSGPMSFKQFLVHKVGDDVSPKEAQDLYDQYLTEHFGNQLRAKFEQEKNQKDVYAAYHPSAFESSLAQHQEGAAAAASLLAADIQDGKLEPSTSGFNQGLMEGEDAEGGEGGESRERPQAPEGPVCLWKPSRVVQDYKVAKKLVAVVDHQRGLQLADNPLLPQDVISAAAGGGAAEGAQDGEGKDADMDDQGEGAKAAQDGTDAAGNGASAPDSEAVLRAVLDAVDKEDVSCDEEAALLDRLGQLDLLLTWLWRVHGINYYAGQELLLEAHYLDRSNRQRTIRGPRPEEGEEQDEDEAKAELAELAEHVDKVWAARVDQADPLLQGCQREEIQSRLDAWMHSEIKQEGEKKWGSSFSNKFFLEKRFVVKHILNKHQDKLDAHKEVIRSDLYWERYEAAKLTERAAKLQAAKQQAEAAAAAAGSHAAAEGVPAAEWQEGGEVEEARGGAGRGPMRGRGRGPMAGARGRGIPAPPPAALMGDMPVMDPAQMMMMGGLPGPIILPGPGMMGGMPGAIPLGGPMMFDPSMMAGDLGGMPIIIPPQGGRGMGGRGMMRGRGGRGMGGRGMAAPPGTKLEAPGYLKHYYDLDAPANNRAVLDYGDL